MLAVTVPIFWVFMGKGFEQEGSEAFALLQAWKMFYLVPDLDTILHGQEEAIFIFPSPELPSLGILAVAIF